MRIDVITIFPELFEPFVRTSLVGRAVESGLLEIVTHDLRAWSTDPHRSVDDEPYGGGGGMVMTAMPWIAAVDAIAAGDERTGGERPCAAASPAPPQPPGDDLAWRILLSPQGAPLDDAKVRELAARPRLVFLCGRYEGIDERVAQTVVDEEISIGDYVLAGGELAAMVVVESVSRFIPGVVGFPDSVEEDSFRHGLLDHPHYTRPREVAGLTVPEVLLSGDHRAIREWRRKQAMDRTRRRRPDLLGGAGVSPQSCKRAGEEG